MSKWNCLKCGQSEGVVNGVCRRCGPTQTFPLDEAAEKEAGVEEAAKNKVDNSEAEAEAEAVNQASVEASIGTEVDTNKL